jgi:PAS domain S-box-containing protein
MKKTIDEVHKNKTRSQKTTNRRKLADVSQLAIEEKFRDLLENVQEGYFEIDLAGNFTFINESVCRVLGYSKKELMGINSRKFTDQDDGKKVFQAYNKVYKTKKPLKNISWHIIRKDRSKRYIEGSISLRKDLSGKPIGFRVIANDFTERKRANEALRQNEERYRTLVENASDIIFRTDNAGHFTFVNPAALRITGYEEQVIIGMHYPSLIHPDMRSEAIKFFDRQFIKGLHNAYSEYPIITKDGHEVWLGQNTQLIVEDGKVTGFQSVARDITERKRVESQREAALEALRESEKKYRRITENMSDIVTEMNSQGIIVYISPSHQKIFGDSLQDMVGTSAFDRLHPEDLDLVMAQYMEGVISKTDREVEYRYRHADGHYIWLRSLGHSFYNAAGEFVGSIISSSDITERKQAEFQKEAALEALRESEQFLRETQTIARIGGWKTNPETDFLQWTEGVYRMIEAPMDYQPGLTEGLKYYVPEYVPLIRDRIMRTLNNNEKFVEEVELITLSGERLWVELRGLAAVTDGQNPSVIGTIQDISERKKAEDKLQQTLESLRKAVGTTIQVLVSAVESRDSYTSGHQSRSADLACAIATEMGLAQEKIEGTRMAGIIHDIGKLSIPAEILSKPTKLTEIEFALIKEHARSGYEMLKDVESPWPLAEIVYQHHERMNGSGYPRNLKGDEIIMESQILAVADVVEAMASHRPYRAALGIDAALEEIEKNRGILYDNAVANACLRLFRAKGYQLP